MKTRGHAVKKRDEDHRSAPQIMNLAPKHSCYFAPPMEKEKGASDGQDSSEEAKLTEASPKGTHFKP